MIKVSERFAHPLQVSMNELIGVEVLEAARDANQLNVGNDNGSLRNARLSLKSR